MCCVLFCCLLAVCCCLPAVLSVPSTVCRVLSFVVWPWLFEVRCCCFGVGTCVLFGVCCLRLFADVCNLRYCGLLFVV